MNNHKSHYETLGVSKDASMEEIKKAFRTLSLKTHPDVSSGQGDKFKVISEAYRVLSNDKERRMYNLEVEEATRFGGFRRQRHHHRGPQDAGFGGSGPRSSAAAGPTPNQGLHGVLDTIFRPRNMFLSLTLGTAALFAFRAYNHYDDAQAKLKRTKGGKDAVEAWKNPTTGRWELPAPWDPAYRKLQPKLTMVPREQVAPKHL